MPSPPPTWMLDHAPRQRRRCEEPTCRKPIGAMSGVVEGRTLDEATVQWVVCGPCALAIFDRQQRIHAT